MTAVATTSQSLVNNDSVSELIEVISVPEDLSDNIFIMFPNDKINDKISLRNKMLRRQRVNSSLLTWFFKTFKF